MSASRAIIVVEDDPGMCQALSRLLTAAGWQVRTYGSGEALLEAKGAAGADAFVFDVQLPGIDGFELHQQLMAAGFHVPVIFVTAHDRPSARARAESAGAAAYLTKPFAGQSLIETLTRICVPS